MGLTIENAEPVIAHGKAAFLKPERVSKLLREHGGKLGQGASVVCLRSSGF